MTEQADQHGVEFDISGTFPYKGGVANFSGGLGGNDLDGALRMLKVFISDRVRERIEAHAEIIGDEVEPTGDDWKASPDDQYEILVKVEFEYQGKGYILRRPFTAPTMEEVLDKLATEADQIVDALKTVIASGGESQGNAQE